MRRGGLTDLTFEKYQGLPHDLVDDLLQAIYELDLDEDIKAKRGFDVFFQAQLRAEGYKEITLDMFNPSVSEKNRGIYLKAGLTEHTAKVYRRIKHHLPPWVDGFELEKIFSSFLTEP